LPEFGLLQNTVGAMEPELGAGDPPQPGTHARVLPDPRHVGEGSKNCRRFFPTLFFFQRESLHARGTLGFNY